MNRKPVAALAYTKEPAATFPWRRNSGRKTTENSPQKTSPRQQPTAQKRVPDDAIGSGRRVPWRESAGLQSVVMFVDYCRAWANWVDGTNEVLKVEFSSSRPGAASQTIPQPRRDHDLAHRVGATADEFLGAFIQRQHNPSAAVVHDHAGTAEIGAHHRQTVGHGFQHHQATGVAQTGKEEHIGSAIVVFHRVLRNAADPFDNLRKLQRLS